MPDKDPQLYLIHIRDCCQRTMDYTAGTVGGEWTVTPMILDAVCRNLEIIGEAANKVDESYRKAHPEIQWRNIIDARNLLIHAYDQIKTSSDSGHSRSRRSGVTGDGSPASQEGCAVACAQWSRVRPLQSNKGYTYA